MVNGVTSRQALTSGKFDSLGICLAEGGVLEEERGTVGGRFLPWSIFVHRRLLLADRSSAVLPVSANHRLFITDRYSLFLGICLPLISDRPIVSRSAPIECPLIVLVRRPSVSSCGGV